MFFYSYLLSCTCIYDYMYRICSVAQRRIACSKATRNNSAHVIVDIFLVSGLPNCLCEGELDSAAMTPSWHMPRETICNNLCLLITNSYCWGQLFVYLLAFFFTAVVGVDVLIRKNHVQNGIISNEKKVCGGFFNRIIQKAKVFFQVKVS